MIPPLRVLLVDDEEDYRTIIVDHLVDKGYSVAAAADGDTALALAKEQDLDLALVDIKMPGMDGITLLRHLKELQPALEVIMLTGHGSIETAVQAIKLGAVDYLTKPLELSRLEVLLERTAELRQLRVQSFQLKEGLRQRDKASELVGGSEAIRSVLEKIQQVAGTNSTVLIEGESGTGKELVAATIHRASPRAEGPFITLDCGAMQEALLENELFGHEKGAFTGASSMKRGLLEVADGGTLFMDEVTEMGPSSQARFLRILETGEFRRLGSNRTLQVDVRVIAATNRVLEEEVRRGRFRHDFFYRLNVFRISVPPLRERKQDISLLLDHFIRQLGGRVDGSAVVTPQALDLLRAYDWPGNVRELANVIERALILSGGGPIEIGHLPFGRTSELLPGDTFPELGQVERDHIAKVLATCRGNKRRTARVLGISLRNLYRKLERYGLLHSPAGD